jgi:antitoxin component of RelBE/YafQ-DinJ toxin-antitoxin module
MNHFNTEDFQMPITVTTRIEKDLAKVIDEIAKKEGMDRSTVIRRFLTQSAKEWLIEKNLKDYEQGKVTLWQAATKCDMSLWEMIEEAKKKRNLRSLQCRRVQKRYERNVDESSSLQLHPSKST